MSYIEFCNKVEKAVSEIYGDEAGVYVTDVTKNNGLVLKGLVITKKDSRISPTIYLEQFYGMYEEGITFGEVITRIIKCDRAYSSTTFNADCFTDFDKVKDRIVYKIVNLDMNRELLKSTPYVPWNDLAIVFCFLVDGGGDGYATILVRNEHVAMWHTDAEELYKLASRNTPSLMIDEIDSMDNIIGEMLMHRFHDSGDAYAELQDMGNPCLYVLSNERRIFGATSMLYSEHIRELADSFDSDLFILPSSIHEVIILPDIFDCDTDYMRNMVREINETQVDVEDRLSNNIYRFERDTNEIRLVV
ncbi:MAG: hypothetical protein IJS12_01285 [Lachnospiraceae bacterium]|nr:hypothetical protein [Lachnospiraceae bacterium]